MITASCNDNLAGPRAKETHGALILTQGGLHLALYSISLCTALQIVDSPEKSKTPTLLAYILPLGVRRDAKYAMHHLVISNDLFRSPETQYNAPYWELTRAMKICASQAALAVFRQVFVSVVRHLVAQQHLTSGLTNNSHLLSLTSPKSTICIPHIIVTPPDDDISISLNTVPTPQDAAFGNQLTVPDPEYRVINRRMENPFSDISKIKEYSDTFTDGLGSDGPRSTNTEHCEETAMHISLVEDEDEDEDDAVVLGPTWSG